MTVSVDLDTLVRITRSYRLRRRPLCCPLCGGSVRLSGGLYHCIGDGTIPPKPCGYFHTLAELAVESRR